MMMQGRWFALVFLLLTFALQAAEIRAPDSSALPLLNPPFVTDGMETPATEVDRDGDGVVDYILFKDQKGVTSREELDFNCDGKMDDFWFYRKGIPFLEAIDSDFNGKVDIWVYLLEGQYIERYERDTDGDGKPDLVKSFGGG